MFCSGSASLEKKIPKGVASSMAAMRMTSTTRITTQPPADMLARRACREVIAAYAAAAIARTASPMVCAPAFAAADVARTALAELTAA